MGKTFIKLTKRECELPLNSRALSSEEMSMNWSKWVRQFHRWLSVVFTVAVIINIIALGQEEEPAIWIGLLALIPLILMLLTGLYLFVLPYASHWRSGRRTDG
jgi:hypothetical protein